MLGWRSCRPARILDGEIVVLRDGAPDFYAALQRDLQVSAVKARRLVGRLPAFFLVFDCLYARFQSVTAEPLESRRDRARELVAGCKAPCVIFSETISGDCLTLYRAACDRGLEGIVAKRRGSRYLPGKRTDAWIKMKRRQSMVCAIIGFSPAGRRDFASLLLASEVSGAVRYADRAFAGRSEARGRAPAANEMMQRSTTHVD